jgi:hypothetical protein
MSEAFPKGEHCERCDASPDTEDFNHVVEAFEIADEVLCDSCWDSYLEGRWLRKLEAGI